MNTELKNLLNQARRQFNLHNRASRCLRQATGEQGQKWVGRQIETIEDLLTLTPEELLGLKYCGPVTLQQIHGFFEQVRTAHMMNANNGWMEINLPFGNVYDKKGEQKDSFTKRGLNKPGVLIQMKSGEEFLIGHINPLRGVCDDCVQFDKADVVKKYKVVCAID